MKYILIFILIISPSCKKKSNSELIKNYTELLGENFIGEIFFYKDDVVMFEKPEVSPILKKFKKTDKVYILATRINYEKKANQMFYKVYYKNQFGYIPFNSEFKKEIFAFLYSLSSTDARIIASSLRLRETPDTNGKVIAQIPKGELVEIISEGQYFEKIQNKYDTWFKIQTKDGKIGYSYAGFMTKNLDNELNKSYTYFEDNINKDFGLGYIEIIKEPVYYTYYKMKVQLGDSTPCGVFNGNEFFPKLGDIVPIENVARINGEFFFLVEDGENNCVGGYNGYKGWISEKDVFFVKDIYEYTSEKYGSKFDKKFLEAINKIYHEPLNVKTLNVKELPIKVKENYKFYEINYFYIYYLKDGEYYFAVSLKENGSLKFLDINKDGNVEIINEEGTSSCISTSALIYIWNGKEFKEIYNNSNNINLEFKNKIIIENFISERYQDEDWKSKITKINYYEIKNFVLVPTTKRPN